MSFGEFLINIFIKMTWLSDLIFYIFGVLNLDLNQKIVISLHFFLYEVVKIFILISVIIFIISYIQSYFSSNKIEKMLIKYKGIRANLIGAGLGIISPFCSCSSIPIFIGIARTGVPIGVSFSFLIASPLIDLASLIFLITIFGVKIGIIYTVIGVILAVTAGTIIEKLNLRKELLLDNNGGGCGSAINGSGSGSGDTVTSSCSSGVVSNSRCGSGDNKSSALGDSDNKTACCSSKLDNDIHDNKSSALGDSNNKTACCSSTLDNNIHDNKSSALDDSNNKTACCSSTLDNNIHDNKSSALDDSNNKTACCSSTPDTTPNDTTTSCCDSGDSNNINIKQLTKKDRVTYSKTQMLSILKKTWIYIVISIAIGSAIHNYIPEQLVESFISSTKYISVLLATVAGVPIYTDEMSAMIIGNAFYNKGMPLGTVLAFMLSAAALSIPSMIILKSVMTKKLLFIFIALVTVGIIIIGYIFNLISFIF